MHLYELRRNPEKNKKEELLSYIKNLPNLENMFISFSYIPKLGINPQSEWKTTPIGIYAYPLWLIPINNKAIYNIFPYGYSRQYAIFFKYSGSYLFSQNYTNEDLDKDLSKLSKIYDPEIVNDYLKEFDLESTSPFNILYRLTISLINKTPEQQAFYKKSSIVKWSTLFLDLGYNCIVDTKGIIHHGEKIQSVFFSRKGISNVNIKYNSYFEPSYDNVIYDADTLFKKLIEEIAIYKKKSKYGYKVPFWVAFNIGNFKGIESVLAKIQKQKKLPDLIDMIKTNTQQRKALTILNKFISTSNVKN